MNWRHGREAAKANETWQSRVHRLMLKGLGYEDIAVILTERGHPTTPDAVRAEARILAAEYRLTWLYTGRLA